MKARKKPLLVKIALSLQPRIFMDLLIMLQNTAAVNFSISAVT